METESALSSEDWLWVYAQAVGAEKPVVLTATHKRDSKKTIFNLTNNFIKLSS
jgi:hypothetical protein